MAGSGGSHEQLIEGLSNLVNGLTSQNVRNHNRVQNDNRQETINNAIARLFPSVRPKANTPAGSSTQPPPSRSFDANARKGKKKPYSKPARSSAPVMKDVFLLPNPRMSDVPRGRIREELHLRGFVATAVEITNEMTASHLNALLRSLFSEKLSGRNFQIVRAVGSKIVGLHVSNDIDGKILKHVSGQGPVYVRCERPIATDYKWVQEENENDSEDEVEDFLPDPKIHSRPSCSGWDDSVVDLSTDTTPVQACSLENPLSTCSSWDDNVVDLSANTESTTMLVPVRREGLLCPTCNLRFPVSEIEEHADLCCENSTRTPETLLYESIMFDADFTQNYEKFDMQCEVEAAGAPEDDLSIRQLLESCSSQVKSPPTVINIRRKYIWDDYFEARKKPWVKADSGLRIQFIGEPSVDGGGPRREFFSEVQDAIKTRLFVQAENGIGHVPYESTIALADGAYKVAGEVIAASLVQGGSAPGFFAPWVYQYISGGLESVVFKESKLNNDKLDRFITEVQSLCTDVQIQEILQTDDALDVLSLIGYRGIPSRETVKAKAMLVRSVYLKHLVEPKMPMLDQLAEGLKNLGVLNIIKNNALKMTSVFTPEGWKEPSVEEFMDLMVPEFSESGTRNKELEVNTYKHYCDFIPYLHHQGDLKLWPEDGESERDKNKF